MAETEGTSGATVSRESATESTRRLFFALWPDEAMRQAMVQANHEAVHGCGGRPVAAGNLHVTLAFLGSVPERRLPELGELARAAADAPAPATSALASRGAPARPLELVFDRIEHWRAAHILCALADRPESRVVALARRLQEKLLGSGFAPDLKPFRPHVTVARKVSRPSPLTKMNPVVWRFAELALIESRTLPEGALYSVVEAYPLCDGRYSANNSKTP